MSGSTHGEVIESTPATKAASIDTLPDMGIDHAMENLFFPGAGNPPKRLGEVAKMVPLTSE
jgi:hypothetical protein